MFHYVIILIKIICLPVLFLSIERVTNCAWKKVRRSNTSDGDIFFVIIVQIFVNNREKERERGRETCSSAPFLNVLVNQFLEMTSRVRFFSSFCSFAVIELSNDIKSKRKTGIFSIVKSSRCFSYSIIH